MKNTILTTAFTFLVAISLFAQGKKDQVLMTVEGTDVTLVEFENIYHKNNTAQSIDKKDLNEYVELFINFKLKVKEAEEMGLDTTKKFMDELAGYRKQLAKPYLTDKEVTESLMKEAYNRKKTDVKASHILIMLPKDPSPKDTLEAYNKIMKIRKRVTKGKEDFNKVAKEASEDPSAKENGGDLGYFTAFYMVYPFESAAYNTKEGEVSMPVRTQFGYHLIKVDDKRDNRGEMRSAHIMIKTPPDASQEDIDNAKKKIDEIYTKLKNGEDFENMAKVYSDDKSSAKKGGELPWFGTGRMVAEYEEAAFNLDKDGDISKPIKTQYGWHIVKRLEVRGVGSYEEEEAELKTKISRDPRANKSKESFINKLKKEYNFTQNKKPLEEIPGTITVDYWGAIWDAEKEAKGLNKVLFSLNDSKYGKGKKEYTQMDFAKYLEAKARKQPVKEAKPYVYSMYDSFVDETILSFEEDLLDEKHPEFKALMKEYRDGILLFDLMDQKVWSMAVKDTTGLKEYYEANKNNYMWKERLHARIFYCANADIAKAASKLAKKQDKKGMTNTDIQKELNEDSQLNVKIEEDKFEKGDNEIIDEIEWEEGLTDIMKKDEKFVFVYVKEVIPAQPKAINEARGLITSDYQKHLEDQWIEELRERYTYTINKDVLEKVK